MSIPLNIDWQQILLHLFNFTILAGGLYMLLYQPVRQFVEQREEYYCGIHQEAERVKAEAEKLKDAYEQKLLEAESTISKQKAFAEKELNQLRAQQIAAAREEAEAIVTSAKESARQERVEMIATTSRELMDAAIAAAEKIILGKQSNPYDQFLALTESEASYEQSR